MGATREFGIKVSASLSGDGLKQLETQTQAARQAIGNLVTNLDQGEAATSRLIAANARAATSLESFVAAQERTRAASARANTAEEQTATARERTRASTARADKAEVDITKAREQARATTARADKAEVDLAAARERQRAATARAEAEEEKLGQSRSKLSLSAIAGYAAIGTAIVGLISKVKEYTDLAGVQEKAEAQLAQTIKSTGGAAGLSANELKNYASQLQSVTTFGDEAIIGAESLLLTFTNIGGPVVKEATATILDMSQALNQDLKSSSIQLGKALNDPIEGITALTRVGVSFTDEQKNLIRTLVETGQTAEAQKVILAELNKEFGGQAAAAAETYTGRLQQLSNAWGDAKEQVGFLALALTQNLIPILTTAATTIATDLSTTVSAFSGEMSDTAAAIVEENSQVTLSIDELITRMQGIEEASKIWGGLGQVVTGTKEEVTQAVQDTVRSIVALSDSSEEMGTNLEAAGAVVRTVIDPVTGLEKSIYTFANGVTYTSVQLEEMKGWLDEQARAASASRGEMTAWEARIAQASETTQRYTGEIQINTEALKQLGVNVNQNIASATTFDEKIRLMALDMPGLSDAFDEWAGTVSTADKGLQSATRSAAGLSAEQMKLQAGMADLFTKTLDTDGAVGFFNETLAQMSDRQVYVSNLTQGQRDDIEALQEAYDKTADTINDYQLGIKGANLTEEARTEKIAELNDQLANYGAQLSELNSVGGEYANVAGTMTLNQDAVNNAFFEAAQSQGASAEQLAGLASGLGLYSDTAINAALQTTLINAKIQELTAQVLAGKISVDEAQASLNEFAAGLNSTEKAADSAKNSLNTVEQAVALLDGRKITIPVLVDLSGFNLPDFGDPAVQSAVNDAFGGPSPSSGTSSAPAPSTPTAGARAGGPTGLSIAGGVRGQQPTAALPVGSAPTVDDPLSSLSQSLRSIGSLSRSATAFLPDADHASVAIREMYAKKREEIERLQARFVFLQQQLALIQNLQAAGLDPAVVLKGIKLGPNANQAELAEASVKTLNALVGDAEKQLSNIFAPSYRQRDYTHITGSQTTQSSRTSSLANNFFASAKATAPRGGETISGAGIQIGPNYISNDVDMETFTTRVKYVLDQYVAQS